MVGLVAPLGASAKEDTTTATTANNNNPCGAAPPMPPGVGWWSQTTALRWPWLCSASTAVPGDRGLR